MSGLESWCLARVRAPRSVAVAVYGSGLWALFCLLVSYWPLAHKCIWERRELGERVNLHLRVGCVAPEHQLQ